MTLRGGLALTLGAGLGVAVLAVGPRAAAGPAGDAERGRGVFAAKQCVRCHRARGEQGIGPVLEDLRRPQGAFELAGRLWNHAPAMFMAIIPHPKEEPIVTAMRVCSMAVVIAVVGSMLFLAPASAQVKPPPDFDFSLGKDSPGKVTFSHEQHKAKVEKCTACHVKIFKMKKGQTGELTMAKMKAGELCGACHNGKTEIAGKVVFVTDDKANCEKCHKK